MADAFHKAQQRIKDAKRIVIKLGTNLVVDEKGNFNYKIIYDIARQMTEITDKEFVIVSSGAIGLGNSKLNWEKSKDLVLNQCSASVGQSILMKHYSDCFENMGINTSQLLLTHENLKDRRRKNIVKKLLLKLISLNIIPIINENDSVSTEEITFGDNDLLSAKVSNLINADLLILLSNVNGLYSDFKNKKQLNFVEKIDSKVNGYVQAEKSRLGKGGMSSKLIAAQLAADSDTITVLANGSARNNIQDIVKGRNIGTIFCLKDVKK